MTDHGSSSIYIIFVYFKFPCPMKFSFDTFFWKSLILLKNSPFYYFFLLSVSLSSILLKKLNTALILVANNSSKIWMMLVAWISAGKAVRAVRWKSVDKSGSSCVAARKTVRPVGGQTVDESRPAAITAVEAIWSVGRQAVDETRSRVAARKAVRSVRRKSTYPENK